MEARLQACRKRSASRRARHEQPVDDQSPGRRPGRCAALHGRADLVRGDYDFAGRNFKLDRGIIRFQGENPPNPLLDIHAVGPGPGPRRERDRHRAPASSPRSPSPARRRSRRTSSCRGSCSAPPSPTCRRPKRFSSPPPSQRSSRGRAASIRSTRCAGRSGSTACGSSPPTSRRAKDRDRRGQVHHAQIVRRGRDRRSGLFRDPHRVSDDPLALAFVDGLDHRPVERERSGEQGLLAGHCLLWVESGHFTRLKRRGIA